MGLIRPLLVHQASLQDARGGKCLLAPLGGVVPRLKRMWAASGYQKEGFCQWVQTELGSSVELVAPPWSGLRGVWVPEGVAVAWEQIRPRGFHVLPPRWVVERTFAWLSTWRRLSTDSEGLPSSEEAWIYLALIRLMLRRLAQNSS